MKKLEIMMTINANNQNQAECFAKDALADLAKAIARRNGSFMIGGQCDVTENASGIYRAKATMDINEYDSLNETVYTVQALWMTKPEIFKSAIFVGESETPKAKEKMPECDNCGCVVTDGYIYTVNPNTNNEYKLCDDCLETAMDNGDVYLCDCCAHHISDLIENPVTHINNICPCCGETLDV